MIESYSFGRITINGKTYTSDVIIFPDRVKASWWRKNGHSLCLEDIQEILKEKPEALVIGSGSAGLMRISSQMADEIRKHGIELIVERTADAVKTYNRLCNQYLTVGAFHLTC